MAATYRKPFNSLYEIHVSAIEEYAIGLLRAFNSLYEILVRKRYVVRADKATFNSLYEILGI